MTGVKYVSNWELNDMPAKASLTIRFNEYDPECGGVKIQVPKADVDPTEAIRIFLWGPSEASLKGYTLTQGAYNLGSGILDCMPGQIEHKLFHMQGDKAPHKFDWPMSSINRVHAYGHLWKMNGSLPEAVANPGEDVTRLFTRSGSRCLLHLRETPALMGSIQAWSNITPWCRVWEWTAPREPNTDFTGDGCPPEDQREDQPPGTAWFFLMRWGILQEEFKLEVKPYLSNRVYVIETANRMEFGFGKSERGATVPPGWEGPPMYYFDDGPADGVGAIGARSIGSSGIAGGERLIPLSLFGRDVTVGFTVKSPSTIPTDTEYFEINIDPISGQSNGQKIRVEFDGTPWLSVYSGMTSVFYPEWFPPREHLRAVFQDGQWHTYEIIMKASGVLNLKIDGTLASFATGSYPDITYVTDLPWNAGLLPVAHKISFRLYSCYRRSPVLLSSVWLQAG